MPSFAFRYAIVRLTPSPPSGRTDRRPASGRNKREEAVAAYLQRVANIDERRRQIWIACNCLTKGTEAELETRRLIIFHVKGGINDRFSMRDRDRVRRVRYTRELHRRNG